MAETRQKCAIVTGAARGIGAGVARHLAGEGWRIACVDIDGAAADAIAAETGGVAIQCDVGKEADVERLVTVARARLGRIDAIVSNAGVGKFAPLHDTSLADWNHVLATNLTATFLLAKAAAADLRQARGSIVTIASTRAHMSEPGTLAYSASKGGLVALTHALAMTLAPDVRVNCVSPGWIDTGRHGDLKPERSRAASGRTGRPARGRGGGRRLPALRAGGLRHGGGADRRRRHDAEDDLHVDAPANAFGRSCGRRRTLHGRGLGRSWPAHGDRLRDRPSVGSRDPHLSPVLAACGIVRLASGHGAGADCRVSVSAYEPGVAVWTIGWQATRIVERQSGSEVRRWGV